MSVRISKLTQEGFNHVVYRNGLEAVFRRQVGVSLEDADGLAPGGPDARVGGAEEDNGRSAYSSREVGGARVVAQVDGCAS